MKLIHHHRTPVLSWPALPLPLAAWTVGGRALAGVEALQ